MKNTGENRLPPVNGHIVYLTLNLSFIGVIYVVLAGVVASLTRVMFSRFNETWTNGTLGYQLVDVSLELSLLVVLSFWITYFVHFLVPVLPVPTRLEQFIELYGGRMVFTYAVFLFADDLKEKLLFVYNRFTGGGVPPSRAANTKGY